MPFGHNSEPRRPGLTVCVSLVLSNRAFFKHLYFFSMCAILPHMVMPPCNVLFPPSAGGENHWSEGSLVFRATVCGWERAHNLAEVEQEGMLKAIFPSTGWYWKNACCQAWGELMLAINPLGHLLALIDMLGAPVDMCLSCDRFCNKMCARSLHSSSSSESSSSQRMCLRSWSKTSPRDCSSYRLVLPPPLSLSLWPHCLTSHIRSRMEFSLKISTVLQKQQCCLLHTL